jgi:hypothetical protein
MALVAPLEVLAALKSFQAEISYINDSRGDDRYDQLLSVLLREMGKDIHPYPAKTNSKFSFRLLGLPPED